MVDRRRCECLACNTIMLVVFELARGPGDGVVGQINKTLEFHHGTELRPVQEVEDLTISLLDELDSVDGIIMGITEDIPEPYWQASCTAIMDNLDKHAADNPAIYA